MNRLLFVDDEPRLLQALKQSLRSQRKRWEMEFVESGEAALKMLSTSRFDAVISDMRMPGIDGAELLGHVRMLQPEALRIVLSGQMDDSTAARAAGTAHRFLAKPCETGTLVANLSRALELRDQLSSEALRTCIGGMTGLPSLPKHCAALNRALQDDKAGLKDVARIIEADVGMTVKVLQLVNSAFFGLARPIASIEQAIMHLGLNALHTLVIANAFFEELSSGDAEQVHLEQSRSILAAQYARRFVLERRQSEVAVCGAMLHNVGRLALMSRLPDEHQANCEYARAHTVTTNQAELARMGVTQAAVGAYLLGLWGLPFEVIHAVGSQNGSLETLTTLDASAVVHLAKGLVAERLLTAAEDAVLLPPDLLERLGVVHVLAAIREEHLDALPGQMRAS